jgi:hypothetical protein
VIFLLTSCVISDNLRENINLIQIDMECTNQYDCKCDECVAKTHPKWCRCRICVRTMKAQKDINAPDDHPDWCRCHKCLGP